MAKLIRPVRLGGPVLWRGHLSDGRGRTPAGRRARDARDAGGVPGYSFRTNGCPVFSALTCADQTTDESENTANYRPFSGFTSTEIRSRFCIQGKRIGEMKQNVTAGWVSMIGTRINSACVPPSNYANL